MRKFTCLLLTALTAAAANVTAAPPTTIAQPKGEKKIYSLSSFVNWKANGEFVNRAENRTGFYSEIWYDTDGSVYMRNPVGMYNCDAFIVGTREGDKITFTLPQRLSDQKFMTRLNVTKNGFGLRWACADEGETIEMTIDGNGIVRMADYGTVDGTPAVMFNVGYVQSGTYKYNIFNAGDVICTPVETANMTLPDGLTADSWGLTSDNQPSQTVQVAISGSDIYFTPFPELYPDVFVKGEIKGNKAVFKSGQFMGKYNQPITNQQDNDMLVLAGLFCGAQTADNGYTITDTFEMDYSASGRTLSSDGVMVLNAGNQGANVLYATKFPKVAYQGSDLEYADPVAPVFVGGFPKIKAFGRGNVTFELSSCDVEEHIFDTNKAYYNLYVDGDLYTFSRNNYRNLPEATMTNIPYNFSESGDFVIDGSLRTVNIYADGLPTIGVRAVFVDDQGKEHASEIVNYDFAANYPDGREFSVSPNPTNTGNFGTSKLENYDLAISLHDESLVGRHVTGMMIPVVDSENLEFSIWLSKELKTDYDENDVNIKVADICEQKVDTYKLLPTAKNGYIFARFDEPYEITADGVYAGYTVKVKALDDNTRQPVVVVPEVNLDGFLLHSSRTYLKWTDQGSTLSRTLAMSAIIDGEFAKNAAGVYYIDDVDLELSTGASTTVTIANHGLSAISNVEYEWSLLDKNGKGSYTFSKVIPEDYNSKGYFTINIPALEEAGSHKLNVTITKVNGYDNLDAGKTNFGYVNVLHEEAEHLAVLEEYTGTWCGWCPRGFVGLELMNEKYPGKFIGVSYHNNDPMAMMQGYPAMVAGFPGAWIDRVIETDAYLGESNDYSFGVDKVWKRRCDVSAPCHVGIKAEWTADNVITATATTRFVKSTRDEYRLEYVLLADGLTGDTDKWAQHNYFSTMGAGYVNSEGMEYFLTSESVVPGLVFNDVAIYTSGHYGISGSLDDTTPFEDRQHVYEIMTDFANNKDNENIIQKKENLRVAVFVLRFPFNSLDNTVSEYGEIVNARVCRIGEENHWGDSGVDETLVNDTVVSEEYYDLQGFRVANPTNGCFIRKSVMSNGRSVSEKVVLK